MSSTQEAGEIFGDGKGPAQAMLRSPTVLIASVGLWGMNLFFFRLFGIDYVHVLNYDLVKEKLENGTMESNTAIASGGSGGSGGTNMNGGGGGSHNSSISGGAAVHASGGSNNISSGILSMKDSNHVMSSMNNNKVTRESHAELAVLAAKELEYQNEDDIYGNLANDPFYDSQQQHRSITWSKLVALSMSMLFLLHLTTFTWMDVLQGGSIGAIMAFYTTVTLAIVIPIPATQWLRKGTYITLQRIFELINPRCSCITACCCPKDAASGPRPIPFIDVFVADAMCSLSKVFFDWGMLWHMAIHYPNPVPPSAYNIVIPSACAAVPYVIRARQCIIMYNVTRLKGDPKRFSHLWNALKYSTSIFPLCLSAYQKTIATHHAAQLENLLILLLTINALYALYWDIVMDWGMMQNPAAVVEQTCVAGAVTGLSSSSERSTTNTSGGGSPPPPSNCSAALLRPKLRFGMLMSVVIVVADALLRFSWVLRFYDDRLFPTGDHFVLATQFLEVFRRAIWNLLRVEWEHIKQVREQKVHSRNDLHDEEKVSFLSAPISLSMAPLPKAPPGPKVAQA